MLNTCKMKFYFVKSGLFEQKRRFLNIMTCKIRRLGYEIPAALLTERFRPVRGSVFLVRHIPEQQRDAPHGGQAHNGIDDPADHAGRSAAGEGHQVELEQPHAAPVQRFLTSSDLGFAGSLSRLGKNMQGSVGPEDFILYFRRRWHGCCMLREQLAARFLTGGSGNRAVPYKYENQLRRADHGMACRS